MLHTEAKLNDLIVETRALLDAVEPVKESLTDLGAEYVGKVEIKDEFFADLSEIIPKHTFEKSNKAARIRSLKENDKTTVIATVREVPEQRKGGKNLHDATKITFFKTSPLAKIEELREAIKSQGFLEFVCEIVKTREIYALDEHVICIDNIDSFGFAIEIRTTISKDSEVEKVKILQITLLDKLGIPKNDIVQKSYTHMIIDARIKADPKVKIFILSKTLAELAKEKDALLLQSGEFCRNEGDGWHDNAAWDYLCENIRVLEIRIANLKKEISDLRRTIS